MTNQGPFRAPDEVLKLEQQLREKNEECEDLRREVQEAEELAAAARRISSDDAKNAREWWTWRLVWVLAAACALALIFWGYSATMRPEVEGDCRDAVVKPYNGTYECPYAGQSLSAVGEEGQVKCTCPTVAPAGSGR